MIKAEKSPKKNLKICRRASLGGWGESGIAGQGGLPVFMLAGFWLTSSIGHA